MGQQERGNEQETRRRIYASDCADDGADIACSQRQPAFQETSSRRQKLMTNG